MEAVCLLGRHFQKADESQAAGHRQPWLVSGLSQPRQCMACIGLDGAGHLIDVHLLQ